MKKIFSSAILLLLTVQLHAQFNVSKTDGTPLTSGQIISFNSIVYSDAALSLKINSTSPNNINLLIKCIGMTNTDGQLMSVCFGPDCYNGASIGEVYPHPGNVSIAPGGNDTSSHFINSDPGTASVTQIDYVFKIYQVNSFGTEIGTPFTFTYRYNSALSTNAISGLNASGIAIKSTQVKNELTFDVFTKSEVKIYDLNGKLLISDTLNYGTQNISVTDLNSGIYIANFINDKGVSSTLKFIKI